MTQHHILSLSGGKDSTALALLIKQKYPKIHEKIRYIFFDTGCDLKETYSYLNKIEVFTDKKITYVKPERSFDDIFLKSRLFPGPHNRWCTVDLKVKPSQKFLESIVKPGDKIKLYIGIRADEGHRAGALLQTNFQREFVEAVYPLVEEGFNKDDVERILIDTGINYPDYYSWRPRNGCYFCPFQSLYSWVMLYEHHPDLYEKAMEYEKLGNEGRFVSFGFNLKMRLSDIIKPQNIEKIKSDYLNKPKAQVPIQPGLKDIFAPKLKRS